jgi:hypothetical protein
MQRPGPRNRLLNRDPQTEKVSKRVSSWLNFNPLSLAPQLWLDASDTATITESSGAVSQWDDKSGNGFNVIQATGANQPTTGVATLNNKNVIQFDGGDSLGLVVSPFSNAPYTTFIVFKFGALDTAVQYVLDNHTDPAQPINQQSILSTISTTSLRVGAGLYPTIQTGLTTSATYAVDWVVNGVTSDANINGKPTGVISLSTQARDGIRIGAAFNDSARLRNGGVVAEVLCFDTRLLENDRLLMRRYLFQKWGVTP